MTRKEYNKAYRESPAGKAVQWKHALARVGWTPKAWEVAMEKQNRVCALCGRPFTEDNPPVADHDHETDKPRGILHRSCNTGIGQLGDDPKLVRLALIYLEVWS
jgi:hypothetical protein